MALENRPAALLALAATLALTGPALAAPPNNSPRPAAAKTTQPATQAKSKADQEKSANKSTPQAKDKKAAEKSNSAPATSPGSSR